MATSTGRNTHIIRTKKGHSHNSKPSHFFEEKKDPLNLLVCLRAAMLGSSTKMMLFLLVCIGLLADSRCKVSALRDRDFFLRQTEADKEVEAGENAKLKSNGFPFRHTLEDQGMLKEKRRFLEEINRYEVKAEETQEQKNKKDGSFESSKRRVRRGSDPIHNKGQPLS